MKRTLSVLFSTLALLQTSAVLASVPLPCGWYLEGGAAETKVSGKTYPGVASKDEEGTGWNLGGGYKFMPYFGIDLGYTSYADTRLENSEDVTMGRDRHYSVNLAAKGMFPIRTTGLEVFAKVGISRLDSEIGNVDESAEAVDDVTLDTNNEWTYGLFVGAGVDYSLAREVQVDLQWNRAYGNDDTGKKFDAILLGVTILFQVY